MEPHASITVARNSAELAALIPQWEALASSALEPNPFYEWWTFIPALEAQSQQDLCCVLVWLPRRASSNAQMELAGIFPFKKVRRFKGLPLTVLSSWKHSSWPLCTPLIRADAALPCLRALQRWLEEDGDGACAAEFRYLPGDGAFIGQLADVVAGSPAMLASETFSRALLRKGGAADQYLEQALSGRSRKDLRRKERRLQELGKLEHVALGPGEDAERWIREFLELEAAGWKGARGGALAANEGTRRFAVAMLAEAHRRNRLQMVGLNLDGRPLARCCNLLSGQGSYAYRTAYDERFADFSPGIMAEIDSIRHFHDLPVTQWMDSLTEPDNATLNRLWLHRRTMQNVVVGVGSWGEMWVSMLPLLRWTKRHVTKLKVSFPASLLLRA